MAQVNEKEDNPHKLGLAAFAEKKFGKAESLFKQSADTKIKSLKFIKEKEQQLSNEIISDYRLAGDAAYNNYQFQKAMSNYEKASSYANRDTQPRLWAQIQIEIGNASGQKGIRAESHRTHEYLKKSISAYYKALQVYTRDQLPQDWAMTQINLGNTLQEQGIRTGGEQGKTLLAEAVEAFESALEVFKAARMGWHVGITEKNIDEAMRAKRFWRRRSKPTATPCQEELNAIDGGK